MGMLKKIARDAGIQDATKLDADLLRVKIFEETLLLGCAGYLEAQHKPTLVKFVELLFAGISDSGHYGSKTKQHLVELIMCNVFSLSPPAEGEGDEEKGDEEEEVSVEEKKGSKKRGKERTSGRRSQERNARRDEDEKDEQGDDNEGGSEDGDDDDDESVSSVLQHHRSAVSRMKVAELRSYCAQYGLDEEGLKVDLVERVFGHMSAGAPGSSNSNSGGSGRTNKKKVKK